MGSRQALGKAGVKAPGWSAYGARDPAFPLHETCLVEKRSRSPVDRSPAPGGQGAKRKVTAHFTAEEFGQPARHGWRRAAYPARWIAGRLRPLCGALEVLRAALGGRPMTVVSGYRSAAYNRAIGGARRSQHVEGRAADLRVSGVTPAKVHAVALELQRQGKIRIGGLGKYPGFVHVDVRPGKRLARWEGSRRET